MRKIDRTGHVYGRLTVIEEAGRRNKRLLWRCRCECGNEVVTLGGTLQSGGITSCGCKRIRDLSGHTFGKLRVVKLMPERLHRAATWLCICECGTETIVTCGSLTSGHTRSCGCLQREVASDTARKARIAENGLNYAWRDDRQVWQVRVVIDGRDRKIGCFKNEEDAKRAAAEARADFYGDTRALEILPPSDLKMRRYTFPVRADHDYPNIYWVDNATWNPWMGQINSQGKVYTKCFPTPEEACLWAMHRKLEFGHPGRDKTLAWIEKLEAIIESEASSYDSTDSWRQGNPGTTALPLADDGGIPQ